MSRSEQFEASPPRPVVDDASSDDALGQFDLRLRLDQVADIEARQLQASAQRSPTRTELSRLACRIYDARRTRDKMLAGELFGEPAWDMLLALYCLPARGERLTVTALSHAANVPQTTGHRWQAILTKANLIERGPPEIDARRQFVRLTEEGRILLTTYLTRLFYCDTPVPRFPDDAGS